MSDTTITLTLPEPMFRHLQRLSEITHRPVENLVITTINVALPLDPSLPTEVANELAGMTMLSDEALWAASESALAPSEQRRLSQLNHAGDARSLTNAETAELSQLIELYDRAVLRRARALAILAFRGYAIADRTELPVADNSNAL